MRVCAGNWKMNGTAKTVHEISKELNSRKKELAQTEVIVGVPYTLLMEARKYFDLSYKIAAQALSPYGESGAFTGEVGGPQIKDTGAEAVIIGHSERSIHMNESAEEIKKQLEIALKVGLEVILCVGETEEERNTGKTEEVILSRLNILKEKISGITQNVIVAYEPVWAIGGKTAPTSEEIQPIVDLIGTEMKRSLRAILYGGSVTKENAKSLLQTKNLSGFLVGGASLTSEFVDICTICSESSK